LCGRDPDAAEEAITFHLGEAAELIVEKMENMEVHRPDTEHVEETQQVGIPYTAKEK
jgi:hypothetical protein